MIIGGIAVIGHGVPRDTSDIDAAKHDILPREEDPIGFARQFHMVLVEHKPTEVTLDISLAWLPFEREAMSRASEIDFGGVPIRAAAPEDLIVYKATAWRDRDRADIHPQRVVIIEQMIREAQ
jgi:predicted nucleotidyltransferase